MVEHGVDRWATHTVVNDIVVRIAISICGGKEGPRPNADIGVLAKCMVGNLQDNAKHVLVNEEIAPRKFEVMQKPDQVEEEGVATDSGKEPVGTGLGDMSLATERHGGMLNYNLSAVFIMIRIVPNGPANRCPLLPIHDRRELNTKRDFGERIRICINLQLVQTVALELGRECGS